jgi:tripartite-type tricarboxylate transporter receptor subunit TctC
MPCLLRFLPALAAALLWSAVAVAEPPAEFYQGKSIRLLIGADAGGEGDLWARTIARHWSDHIPGKPGFVPEDMPGASGLAVMNRLYNTMPKDGTALGLTNRGIPFEPLLGGQGFQFDAQRMNWIGSPEHETTVCAARKDAAVKSLAGLRTEQLTVGATGSGADTAIYPAFLSALLGLKFRVVLGYTGSRSIALAIQRNEVQGICVAYDSLATTTIFRENSMNLLLQATLAPDPRFPQVPMALSLVRSPEENQAMQLFFARTRLGRPFVAPPDVPPDRVMLLRRAFDETMRDPAFLADAKTQGLTSAPVTGESIAATIAAAYKTPPDIVKRTIVDLGRKP